MNLSKNLTRNEIVCRCGCGFDRIAPELVETFQAIRDFIGRSMIVTSGCRCRTHNARVGGVANSAHITGEGMDLRVEGWAARFLYQRIQAAHAAGLLPRLQYCYIIVDSAVHIGVDKKPRTSIWGG